jgi:alkylhydroperoxidase/carboxymuconolactone decarboxylase family protein YurZ
VTNTSERATDPNPSIAPDVPDDIAGRYRGHAQQRGYHFNSFEWLARRDPDFERMRLGVVDMTYLREDGSIPPLYRELICAAVLAFRMYPSVKKHLARALREGATVEQVIEAMELISVPGGMATLHFALDQLVELEQEQPELFRQD